MKLLAIKQLNQIIQVKKEQQKNKWFDSAAIVLAGVEKKLILEEREQNVLKILGKVQDNNRELIIGPENLFDIDKNFRYPNSKYREFFAFIKF